jgi:hypothetical protein
LSFLRSAPCGWAAEEDPALWAAEATPGCAGGWHAGGTGLSFGGRGPEVRQVGVARREVRRAGVARREVRRVGVPRREVRWGVPRREVDQHVDELSAAFAGGLGFADKRLAAPGGGRLAGEFWGDAPWDAAHGLDAVAVPKINVLLTLACGGTGPTFDESSAGGWLLEVAASDRARVTWRDLAGAVKMFGARVCACGACAERQLAAARYDQQNDFYRLVFTP